MSELRILCDNYKTKSAKWISTKIGRTEAAILIKANDVGLRKNKKKSDNE